MSEGAIQIVGTWHNLLIFRDGEILDNLTEPDYGHYGVTWNSDNLFALFADRGVLDGTNQVIRVFDKNLRPVRDILAGEIAGVHQIIWHDGYLWITSTNSDTIVVADDLGNVYKRWQSAGNFDPSHPGKQHVNSIWFDNDHVYTLAHGLNHGDPAIYCHTYPGLELAFKISISRGAHNVYCGDNLLYLADSKIMQIGGDSVKLDKGTIRGLSITDDRYYVGSSRIVEDRAVRRADPKGVIWQLDRELTIIKKHDLDYGPVGEIRTLNQVDYAHHSMPWSGKYGIK